MAGCTGDYTAIPSWHAYWESGPRASRLVMGMINHESTVADRRRAIYRFAGGAYRDNWHAPTADGAMGVRFFGRPRVQWRSMIGKSNPFVR